MFINKSDGEPAMKALKEAAAKAIEGIESISQESPVVDHQANGRVDSEDVEGTDESDKGLHWRAGWDDSLHMMIRF